MHIINTLAPVFLVIALGAFLSWRKFFSPEFVKALTRLAYWVGLPCLLFSKIATAAYDLSIAGKTFLVVLAGMFGCMLVAYITSFFLRVPHNLAGVFTHGAYRGNLAFVGLPVIIYSFANSGGFDAAKMETIAALVLGLIVPFYSIFGVIVLLGSQHKIDRHVPGKIARELITNPLIIACVLGMVYRMFFASLPTAIERTISTVGQMALPIALIGIGATLIQCKIVGQIRLAMAVAAIKLAAAPLIGYFAADLLGLRAGETRIALLFLATPTAIASYVLVDQLGCDSEFAAKIVVISSVFSMVSLAVVVGLF